MKLDRQTTLTLIGIFLIAGLCVGGYSSIGHEGLDGKITIPPGKYLGDNKKSYGGILELKALEKQYRMLLAKLSADSRLIPGIDMPSDKVPGSETGTAAAGLSPPDGLLKCTNPAFPHLSPNTAFGICYSDAAWTNFNHDTNETTNCEFGLENNPAACNLGGALSGKYKKSVCSNAPACNASVSNLELGTMGGTVDLHAGSKPKTFEEYTARLKQDEDKLNAVIAKMEKIVTGGDFKGTEAGYAKGSKKALEIIENSTGELDKWRKKVEVMRAQTARSSADLENSKLSGRSHYYFYITWLVLAIIMCGVAFKFLKQPIFSVIAEGIMFMMLAPYVYGLITTFISDAEDYAENININKILGP
jgi:hypothetical protein